MKIAILSRNSKLYSTKRLVEAATERGHEVRVLDVLRCYMNITSHNPKIHYRGEVIEGMDVAEKIVDETRDGNDRPLKDMRMLKVRMAKKKKFLGIF